MNQYKIFEAHRNPESAIYWSYYNELFLTDKAYLMAFMSCNVCRLECYQILMIFYQSKVILAVSCIPII